MSICLLTYGQQAGEDCQLVGNSDATLCWLQKEEYAQVLASLETAPAQDVVPLLLYLGAELRTAVHMGDPVIDVVSQVESAGRLHQLLNGGIVLPACITCGVGHSTTE